MKRAELSRERGWRSILEALLEIFQGMLGGDFFRVPFPLSPTAFALKYPFPWAEANYQQEAIETDKTDTFDPKELLHRFRRKAAREIGVLFVEYFSLFQGHLVPFFILLEKNAEQGKLGGMDSSFSFSHDVRMGEAAQMEKMKLKQRGEGESILRTVSECSGSHCFKTQQRPHFSKYRRVGEPCKPIQ